MENIIGICVIGFMIMGFLFAFTIQSISFLRDDIKRMSKNVNKIEMDMISIKYNEKRYEK